MSETPHYTTSAAVDRLMPPARELALEHAVAGVHSWSEIARLVGVDRSTLAKWRREPTWMAEVRRLQRERRELAGRQVQAEIPKSIRTLIEIRDDEDAPPAVRRSCARDILEIAGVLGTAAEPITAEAPEQGANPERLADFVLARASVPTP